MPAGDGYVRPPLVAAEPPSRRVQVWRFRLLLLLVVLAVAAAVVLLIRAFAIPQEANPGVSRSGLAPPVSLSVR
jgi:hypothetical protein